MAGSISTAWVIKSHKTGKYFRIVSKVKGEIFAQQKDWVDDVGKAMRISNVQGVMAHIRKHRLDEIDCFGRAVKVTVEELYDD